MTNQERKILKKAGITQKQILTLAKANGGAPASTGKRGAGVGEIRHWKSGPHQKTAQGWVPVKKGKSGKMEVDKDSLGEHGMKASTHGSSDKPHPKPIGKGEYSVEIGGKHVSSPGKKIDVHPDHHTFGFKHQGQVKIAHAETGKVIGSGDDLDEAKEMAGAYLRSDKAKDRLGSHSEKHGGSPGFKQTPAEKAAKDDAKGSASQIAQMKTMMDQMAEQIKTLKASLATGEKIGTTVSKPDVNAQDVVDTGVSTASDVAKPVEKKPKTNSDKKAGEPIDKLEKEPTGLSENELKEIAGSDEEIAKRAKIDKKEKEEKVKTNQDNSAKVAESLNNLSDDHENESDMHDATDNYIKNSSDITSKVDDFHKLKDLSSSDPELAAKIIAESYGHELENTNKTESDDELGLNKSIEDFGNELDSMDEEDFLEYVESMVA